MERLTFEPMREYLQNLARYDGWADEQLIQSLKGPAEGDERVIHLAGHLLAAKRVWLSRIRGEDTFTYDLWPKYSVVDFAVRLRELDQEMLAFVSSPQENFDRIVHYRNQTGNYFDTRLSDILIHVVNHATYHRGQLATAVKNAGGTPAVTDYIAWVRSVGCVTELIGEW